MACRVLVSQPEIEPVPPVVECGILTTGPPGNSLEVKFLNVKLSSFFPFVEVKISVFYFFK